MAEYSNYAKLGPGRALGYLFVESFRRMVQMTFGAELFDFPGLGFLRRAAYRLAFRAGPNLLVETGVRLFRVHRLASGRISIGRNVALSKRVEIDYSGEVVIEDYAMFSEEVRVYTHRHPADGPREMMLYARVKRGFVPTAIRFRRSCWIGPRVTILPGVRVIGENSIVGAGAVVTRDVPDRTVVAGVPARVVRSIDQEQAGSRGPEAASTGRD